VTQMALHESGKSRVQLVMWRNSGSDLCQIRHAKLISVWFRRMCEHFGAATDA